MPSNTFVMNVTELLKISVRNVNMNIQGTFVYKNYQINLLENQKGLIFQKIFPRTSVWTKNPIKSPRSLSRGFKRTKIFQMNHMED